MVARPEIGSRSSVSARVLHITPWFPREPEGVYAYMGHYFRALHAAGVNLSVVVCLPYVPPVLRKLAAARKYALSSSDVTGYGFEVELLRYFRLPRNILAGRFVFALREKLRRRVAPKDPQRACQILHFHGEEICEAAAPVARSLGIPYVVSIHGINPAAGYIASQFARQRLKVAFHGAEAVVLVGSPLERHFRELLGPGSNIRVINNGCDVPEELLQTTHPVRTGFRIVSVSNLVDNKGVDVNIRALSILKRRGFAGVEYRIVGDGPQRGALERLAAALNVMDQVQFLGSLRHRDALSEVAAADAFCLPSWREACGIVYMEAMLLGVLTIGCSGQGPGDFVHDRVTGLLVAARSPDAVADAIQIAVESPSLLREVADRGRCYARERFSWSRNACATRAIYEGVS
jgi:glycosyltransferase involved in cell wall biosynthesis